MAVGLGAAAGSRRVHHQPRSGSPTCLPASSGSAWLPGSLCSGWDARPCPPPTDATGRQLTVRRVAVNAGTYKTLMGWAARWPQRRSAVEGAAGLGRGIAQLLVGGGEDVVDVPATLAARARLLDIGGARKSDPADAASVAHDAMRHKRLRAVVAEDHTTQLRLLAERRDDLAGERIRVLNRLHVLVRDLIPGGAPPNPPLKDARPTARSAPRMERRHIHPASSLDNGSRSQPARYSRLRDPHGHPEPLDRRDRR
ncbi:IS110 family transposase [Micromonospora sp. NPDC005161]